MSVMAQNGASDSTGPGYPPNKFTREELNKVDATKFNNESGVEEAWALKAFRHANVHYKLLCHVTCTKLKLTKFDQELYQHFLATFPRVTIDTLDVDRMKSEGSKRKWRTFCQMFEYHVESYNFGTLLRIDCKEGYSQSNTTLVPRVQFLAIEVARNRQGLNSCHFGKDPNPEKEVSIVDEGIVDDVVDANGKDEDSPSS